MDWVYLVVLKALKALYRGYYSLHSHTLGVETRQPFCAYGLSDLQTYDIWDFALLTYGTMALNKKTLNRRKHFTETKMGLKFRHKLGLKWYLLDLNRC